MHHADWLTDVRQLERCPVRKFRSSIEAPQRAHVVAALLGLFAAAIALRADIAHAHAIVVAAKPAAKSTVAAGTLEIRLDFNSAIDRRRSSLKLQTPDGIESSVTLTDAGPGVLAGRAPARVNGAWELHWQVLSRDGHITRGDIPFFVRDAAGTRIH
jgi:methionine-rich copper-binding protein CopC